ncbi:hypothetical protein ABC255_17410 [Neobacillus sp. 3P2-tot-E-2]|uniref:hypothetical protein n=1 Tax=Neobacillus sp. 3P2-tot-E-2 TaxID=3132212 RepID=UPI0039A18FF8
MDKLEDITIEEHEYPDYKVSLIEVTPGQEQRHLTERIKAAIENLVRTSQSILEILVNR